MARLTFSEYLKAFVIALAIGLFLEMRLRLPTLVIPGIMIVFILSLLWQREGDRQKRRRNVTTMELPDLIAQCRHVIAMIHQISSDPMLAQFRFDGAQKAFQIEALLRRIMKVIEEDEDKHEAARLFLPGYLAPILQELEKYHRLSTRGIKSAEPELQRADAELEKTEERLKQLYEKIHEKDIITLATMNEMLDIYME